MKEDPILSMEGDTADKMVHEGIEITEAAVKLAALGAKNLAALLLALLKDNEKLKGKTNMNTLLRQDRQLAVFHVKKEDLNIFKELAGRYGVLFAAAYHKRQDKNLCDILVKSDDVARVNRILEKMGYPAPGKEADAKNASARAPQNGKSKERGPGWMSRLPSLTNDPVQKQMKKTGPLESLGAEALAAMVLKIAGENSEHNNAASLSRLMGDTELRILPVEGIDVASLQKSATKLGVETAFLPAEQADGHFMLAKESDAPIIGRLFEQAGFPPPTWPEETPANSKPEKAAPTQTPAEKPSVRTRIEEAKASSAKTAPARTRQMPTKTARPPVR